MIVHVCDGDGCTSIADSGTVTGGIPEGWTLTTKYKKRTDVWMVLCPKCAWRGRGEIPSDRLSIKTLDANEKPATRVVIVAMKTGRS